MATADTDIAGFWSWFASEADRLADLVAGAEQARITAVLDEALRQHGLPVTYEVSLRPTGPELVFSADGDAEWASFLRAMVAQAPETTWTFHPQRPRRSLEEAVQLVQSIHGLDLTDARFQVRFVNGRFHLRFLDDALYGAAEGDRQAAAALFLDYALGEALATEMVGGLDFQPSGEGIAMPLMLNELIREAESSRPSDPVN